MKLINLFDQKDQASELRKKRLEAMREMSEQIKTENRSEFEDKEQKRFDKLESEVKDIDTQIDDIERQIKEFKEKDENRTSINPAKTEKEEKKMSRYKMKGLFRKAAGLNSDIQSDPDYLARGLSEANESGLSYGDERSSTFFVPLNTYYRSSPIQAADGGEGAGSGFVSTMGNAAIPGLYDKQVSILAGAQVKTGLKDNQTFPVYSATTLSTVGEASSSSDGAGTFTNVTLIPRRAACYLDYTTRELLQAPDSFEDDLISEFSKAISQEIENKIWGNHTSNTALVSDGLFTGFSIGSSVASGSVSLKKLNQLERNLGQNKADGQGSNIVFVTNPSGKYTLKSTAKVSSTDSVMLWSDDNEVLGYPAFTTNEVNQVTGEDGVVLCNISDLVVGYFGPMAINIDPYSQRANGKIRITAEQYFDHMFVRPASFATGSFTPA